MKIKDFRIWIFIFEFENLLNENMNGCLLFETGVLLFENQCIIINLGVSILNCLHYCELSNLKFQIDCLKMAL